MASFEILAAIDLRGGRVVRLREGDFERETVYDDDPASAVTRLMGEGADAFHVVDLDGARAGEVRHASAFDAIIAAAGSMPVEVGGGIRDLRTAAEMLRSGAQRVVLGTAAIEDPGLARDAVERLGASSVVVALDVRAGRALGHAWRKAQPGKALEAVLEDLAAAGIALLEVTAIDRDGSLDGPDLRLLSRVVRSTRARVIASGGIRSIEDLVAVRDIGCRGAIVGRAIHEGAVDLAAARVKLA